MSDLKEKLITAFGEDRVATNDYRSYIWKGQKKLNSRGVYEQEKIRLVDASDDQLREFYKHCKTMLYNKDPKFPGRVTLLNIIEEQKNKCGVELFYRHNLEKNNLSRFTIMNAIKDVIEKNKLTPEQVKELSVGDLVNTADEFESLPIDLIKDGGIQNLGRYDRRHMTLSFIVRQGIWFSDQEKKEINEWSMDENGEVVKSGPDKLQYVKSLLKIPEDMPLDFNVVTGLTMKEMKSVLSLRSKKYSDLTTDQLKLLRYKLLFILQDQVNTHIEQWTMRIKQLNEVASMRGITLN